MIDGFLVMMSIVILTGIGFAIFFKIEDRRERKRTASKAAHTN